MKNIILTFAAIVMFIGNASGQTLKDRVADAWDNTAQAQEDTHAFFIESDREITQYKANLMEFRIEIFRNRATEIRNDSREGAIGVSPYEIYVLLLHTIRYYSNTNHVLHQLSDAPELVEQWSDVEFVWKRLLDEVESDRIARGLGNNRPPVSTAFSTCDEVRRIYPEGVSILHQAYRYRLDHDKDGKACELSIKEWLEQKEQSG